MNRRPRWIVGGALALAVVAAGTGLAVASGGDDEQQLTGSALDQASAAALEHTGGGTVLEAEPGDDGAAYGVEIRLDDGSVVGVALDENFDVVGPEDEGASDQEGTAEQIGKDED